MNEVKVLSPATIANVVCGFDVLGFALEGPSDEMVVRRSDTAGVRILHHDDFGLPTEAERNVAGVTLLAMLEAARADFGFDMEITKRIMPGSGVGSSAASAAGAAVAANRLLGDRFTSDELIGFAMVGENLASGAMHADNVAPAIRGGFTLVRSNDRLDVISIASPPLFVTVVHPQIEVKTADARSVLKERVTLQDAVRQTANFGSLVAGLLTNDYDLIGRSLEDHLVEPVRKMFIPHFDEVILRAKKVGALGGGIAGSGPSIFTLSRTEAIASAIGDEMTSTYQATDIEVRVYQTRVNRSGVSFI